MKQSILIFSLILSSVAAFLPESVRAHCQVPCGIFNDHARIVELLEDATTVTKAVAQMAELSGKSDGQSVNQMIRWVANKESHAQNVIETLSTYFLGQRVKPAMPDYAERLQKHHAVMLAAVKAKQSSDPKDAEALVAAINDIAGYYPAEVKP